MGDGTNPWLRIGNADYERHMGHESVGQLSVLSRITGHQLALVRGRPDTSVAILGIANGNGLEHAWGGLGSIIGIDINEEFLETCRERYAHLVPGLRLHRIDLVTERQQAIDAIKGAGLIIANLLAEHIHVDNLVAIVRELERPIISITIQVNPDGALVSRSGYEAAFDEVVEHARECDEASMLRAMSNAGYELMGRTEYGLPNGKSFVRLDLSRSR